ncbi:hypothetical protein E1N66_10250 [Pantoea allii]|nr:hypothetical protein E1N66_10250 [Pantoea allii]
MVRGGKSPAPWTKTPGAFLNNAKRWPGNGRTSRMRCVIARAERVMDWLLRLSDLTMFSAQARYHSQPPPAFKQHQAESSLRYPLNLTSSAVN